MKFYLDQIFFRFEMKTSNLLDTEKYYYVKN